MGKKVEDFWSFRCFAPGRHLIAQQVKGFLGFLPSNTHPDDAAQESVAGQLL
jgi:hypothetical protein